MKQGRGWGFLGVPALNYIAEKNMERRLGRSLEKESNAKPLTWGQLLEQVIFQELGIEYQLVSKDTIVHPQIEYWAGSPDANKFDDGRTVCDIKAPITLKSFCQLVDPLYSGLEGMEAMNVIRKEHEQGDKYYWQLVSNSILTDSKWAELIVYVPYLSQLKSVRQFATEFDLDNEYRYYWVTNAQDDELPYLNDGGFYKNLNIIRFEVPESDKKLLEEKVIECGALLQ